ncbi:pimeloyl-ACP methyl ester carboxylesterase [Sporosarcina luteola]|nr:pimeloyl-ACP methyl ester carboxylesterase [Sporosarcina luteola]
MEKIDLEYKVIGTGDAFLIVETGIGGSFYSWYSIIQEVQTQFTVVVYHRAGYGTSQASTKVRTTRNIAEELAYLVREIGIKDKIFLMGHSFGGLCVQQYAKMFPDKIKGILLVDSTSPNFNRLYNLPIPVMNTFISIDKMIEGNTITSQKDEDTWAI